jgi:hydroxypyruvate reductase
MTDPRRRTVLDLLDTALRAVDPGPAVQAAIQREDGAVVVDGHRLPLDGRVVILAVGKAAAAMAEGAVASLEGLPFSGVVVGPDDVRIPGLRSISGEHPRPGARSLAAGRALLEAAGAAGPTDVVIALVSGGGSALAEVPAADISIGEIETITDTLLRSGAPIGEINLVRRHLSSLKNGGLARATRAPVATLVLSDVVGDRPADVASGPTLADGSDPADALTVLQAHTSSVPPSIAAHLRSSARGPEETGGIVAVVGSGTIAAEAAAAAARKRGIAARVGTTTLTGEARDVGRRLAAAARVGLTVHAGETTVTVTGPGRGGRNQELALAAGIALENGPDALVAAIGTDGVYGPTDAAGAFGDTTTVERGRRVGRDALAALAANDAHAYLEATGDLIVTGPTGTNVADLVIVWSTADGPVPYRPTREVRA